MGDKIVFNNSNSSLLIGASLFVIMLLQPTAAVSANNHPYKGDKPSIVTAGEDNVADNNSVREAIMSALVNNPNIKADRAAKQEAAYRIDQAKAGYYPTLDARAAGGYSYLRDKLSANKLNSAAHGTVVSDRYDMSLSVRQMVFDGLDTPNKVEKASKEELQSTKKIGETQELVAFNAAREYITLRRFQRLARLAQENIKKHEQILAKVRGLVSAGRTTIADVHHVQSRLEDAQAAYRDIQGDLESSEARYTEIVGHIPGKLKNARVPGHLLPTSLEAALDLAKRYSRSLEVANATVDVAKADLEVTNSPFYPSLSLEGDAQRNFNAPGTTGNQTNISALAVVRYNLFNGGRDIAKKREYIERVTEAKYKREAELKRTEREVKVSWAEMTSAHRQADALRNAVQTKTRVLDAYLGQFDLGGLSFLQILDAAHEVFLAKRAL
jgi:adhesin transport system outer membrane protein